MNLDNNNAPRRRRVIVRTPDGVIRAFDGAIPADMRRRIDAALRDGSASVSFVR